MDNNPQLDQRMSNERLFVYMRNPEQIFFSGEAYAVSTTNAKGPFDVLGEHENFICIIKDKVTVHLLDKKTKEFPIVSGVLKTERNKVFIFLGVENLVNQKK